MITVEIKEGDKAAVTTEIKPKVFKTKKKGYYINGVTVINGKAHRYSVMLIEMS